MAATDSARYDEAIDVKPKGTRTASTGAVIDPRSHKYPSTCEFATEPSETNSKVEHCITARRPGGEYRASHGFRTISCYCKNHPCTCGLEKAKESVIHPNMNVGDKKKSMGRHM